MNRVTKTTREIFKKKVKSFPLLKQIPPAIPAEIGIMQRDKSPLILLLASGIAAIIAKGIIVKNLTFTKSHIENMVTAILIKKTPSPNFIFLQMESEPIFLLF